MIVAHRLSTVRQADRIVVISEGQVKEEGSHETLMQAKGAYHQLVTSQVIDQDDDKDITVEALHRRDFVQQQSVDEVEDKRPSLLPGSLGDVRVLQKSTIDLN